MHHSWRNIMAVIIHGICHLCLGHREVLRVGKEDSIIIETPGGGGYGKIE
jgi:N-methylhydantoinase B/oxoprolinase/acetone carboxylase alpha subunit